MKNIISKKFIELFEGEVFKVEITTNIKKWFFMINSIFKVNE